MFIKTKTETQIDREIARLVASLDGCHAEKYEDTMTRIERLHKMKSAEMRSSTSVSADTLILATTNLLGIAMIIRHENLNVITSKAMSFVQKPR